MTSPPITDKLLAARAMGQATAAAVPQGHGLHIPPNADLGTYDVIDRTQPQSLGQRMSEGLSDLRSQIGQYDFSPASIIAEAKRQYQQGQLTHAMTPQAPPPMAKTIR